MLVVARPVYLAGVRCLWHSCAPMDGGGMDLAKLLEDYRTRQRELAWQGTFAEYFERVLANSRVS